MKQTKNTTFKSDTGLEQLLHLISLPTNKTANASGVFKGKVISATTGARVFGVVVELVGTNRSYITSPTGYFKLTGLEDGVYLAKFTFPGFKEVTEAIAIVDGETLDMTLALEIVENE